MHIGDHAPTAFGSPIGLHRKAVRVQPDDSITHSVGGMRSGWGMLWVLGLSTLLRGID